MKVIGHLDDDETVVDGAPGQVDLEAVALRIDGGQVDLLQHLAPVGAVTGGDVVDVDAEQHPGVGVGGFGQHQAPPRPVADRSAGDVARADGQIRAAVDGVEQSVQLLGRVAAVGVHLDQHRVLATQAPGKPGQIRRAQSVLACAVHHVHPVRVGQRQLVGELAGAVGAAVVDDQNVHVGARSVHPADDQRQVLPLVVGGDDHQGALTRAFCWPRAAHLAPLSVPSSSDSVS